MIYLDTHVVVWLYEGIIEKISQSAQRAIEENEIYISGMVLLELKFLYEIKKTTKTPVKITTELSKSLGLQVCDLSLQEIAENATQLTWTRDPFDRIIVANAAVQNRGLITKDDIIRKHYKQAMW